MSNLFLPRVNPAAWQGGPAFLKRSMAPWYHVTCVYHVPNILQEGLLVEPPRHTFPRSSGSYATQGGIYVVGGGWNLSDVIGFISARCPRRAGQRQVVALKLRLPVGTRFCMDEDQSLDLYMKLPKIEQDTVEEVIAPLRGSELTSFETCYVAWRLNQKFLQRFAIRVFDQPEILAVTQPFTSEDLPFDISRPSQITNWVEHRFEGVR